MRMRIGNIQIVFNDSISGYALVHTKEKVKQSKIIENGIYTPEKYCNQMLLSYNNNDLYMEHNNTFDMTPFYCYR